MPRPTRRRKPYIVVFCEGESEQAYTDFLKKEFRDVASIKRPSSTGLFEEADNKFKKDKAYRDYAEVTDEVWFFFDVETKDIGLWDARMKIIKRLRSLRKKSGIKVRLLMTTGCIEYWLLPCSPPRAGRDPHPAHLAGRHFSRRQQVFQDVPLHGHQLPRRQPRR